MNKERTTMEKNGKWKSAGDLMKSGITEVPMLWGQFFPQEGLVLLCGGSDCGKTTIAKQLAIAVARGDNDFLGFGLKATHCRALAVLTEDGEASVSASMHKQLKGESNKQVEKNLRFLLETDNVIRDLTEALNENPVDFIFIDTIMDFFRGNPNDQAQVRQNLEGFNKLAKEYHCCICFVHHTIKNSDKAAPDKSKVNGSTAFESKVRSAVELRYGQDENTRLLTVLKCNNMPQALKKQSVKLAFDEKTLSFSNTGQTVAFSTPQTGKAKYDSKEWLGRLDEAFAGGCKSTNAAIKVLSEEFGNDMPSDTWLKNEVAARRRNDQPDSNSGQLTAA